MTPRQKAKAVAALFAIGAGVVGVAFAIGSGAAVALCRVLSFC